MIERILCRCIPKTNLRPPAIISGSLLAAGLLLWLASPHTGWGALARFGGLLLLTAGLYVALRFLLRSYSYTLEQHDSGCIDFVVTELTGRRQITVCRVSLDEISGFRPLARGEKPPRGGAELRVYHYCIPLRPRNLYLLTLDTSCGRALIRFTPDEAMCAWLFRLLPEESAH